MGKKRLNGEGTITQRKDGKWVGALSIGYKPNGKRDRRYVYGSSAEEVRLKLDDLKKKRDRDELALDGKINVKDYLKDFLNSKAGNLSKRTQELYEFQAKRYIIPHIGKTRLDKLKPRHVQHMVDAVREEVSPDAANKARVLLHQALKVAVRQEVLLRNPAEVIEPLKVESLDPIVWYEDEVAHFLEVAQYNRVWRAFYAILTLGLRRGEVLGLRKSDLGEDSVRVRQAVVIVNSKATIGTPKMKTGQRIIEAEPKVIEVLKEQLEQVQLEASLAGRWQEHGLLFPNTLGKPIHPRVFERTWYTLYFEAMIDLLNKLEATLTGASLEAAFKEVDEGFLFPKVRLHDLRHTHVSQLIDDGASLRQVADRVGHSRPSFTLDRYSHLFKRRAKNGYSIPSWADIQTWADIQSNSG